MPFPFPIKQLIHIVVRILSSDTAKISSLLVEDGSFLQMTGMSGPHLPRFLAALLLQPVIHDQWRSPKHLMSNNDFYILINSTINSKCLLS